MPHLSSQPVRNAPLFRDGEADLVAHLELRNREYDAALFTVLRGYGLDGAEFLRTVARVAAKHTRQLDAVAERWLDATVIR